MNTQRLASGLGWFSLALGAAELAAPKKLGATLGVRSRDMLIRSYGLREVAAGIGLLTQKNHRAPWVWARVAGDAVDLGTLGAVLRKSRNRRMVGVALASVAAVTALDVLCGMQMKKQSAGELSPAL